MPAKSKQQWTRLGLHDMAKARRSDLPQRDGQGGGSKG